MLNSLKEKGKILWNIIKSRKRVGLLSTVFVVGAVVLVSLVVAPYANAEATEGGIAEALLNMIGKLFLWIASKFLAVCVFFLDFVIELASYHNYINSGPVALGWILVRDVTNMFFVVILMAIAFGTVLGAEQYEWKKLLVKFVLAAVLVNFSRLICGVIIDAAQVFMMTFISGVAAVAGGNLIEALKLQSVMQFSGNTSATAINTANLVATAMFACFFAFAAMLIMGVYVIVLLGRVVTLWVLVILSPLAFVLSVLPKTQSYAAQWWSEFSNSVIVGPVLAFFLWLSFAVAGGSNIHSEFANESNSAYPMNISSMTAESEAVASQTAQGEEGGTGLLAVMDNDNLASFIIAFAMLLAGVKVTQKLGVAGSQLLGAAAGAATKFATVASGVAAAKWGAKAGAGAVMKTGKFALMKAPLVGGDAWKRRGRAIKATAVEKYADVMRGYEGLGKKLGKEGAEKTGWSGFWRRQVSGAMPYTTLQKEKRVQFREGKAKAAMEEREELHGMGGTELGYAAGRRKMRLERVKDEEGFAKTTGLMIAKAKDLQSVGQNAQALKIMEQREAMILDRKNKKEVADLDYPQLMSKTQEAVSKTQDIKGRLVAAREKGDKKMIESVGKEMQEQAVNNMLLMAKAAEMSPDTRASVAKAFGASYGGGNDSETDGSAIELSRIYGLNAHAEENADLLRNLDTMSLGNGQFQAAIKLLQAKNDAVAAKDGGAMRSAAAVSEGLVKDKETGEMKVVRGFGRGVGEYDIRGKRREIAGAELEGKIQQARAAHLAALGSKNDEEIARRSNELNQLIGQRDDNERNVFRTSNAKLDYYSKTAPLSYQQSTDPSMVLAQSRVGTDGKTEVIKFDDRQLESMSRYLSTRSAAQMKSAFPPGMVEALNQMGMSSQHAAYFMKKLASNMRDNTQVAALQDLFKSIHGKSQQAPSAQRTRVTVRRTGGGGRTDEEEEAIEEENAPKAT